MLKSMSTGRVDMLGTYLVNGALLLYLAGYLVTFIHLLGDNLVYVTAWWQWPIFIVGDFLFSSLWPVYWIVFHGIL